MTIDKTILGGAKRKRTRARGFIDDWSPRNKTRALLNQVQAVLDEYADHLPLTNRQIFYRLVGKHDYPKTENAYNNLCEMLQKARRSRDSVQRYPRRRRRAPRAEDLYQRRGLPGDDARAC